MIRASVAHARVFAAIHAAAVPASEAWSATSFAAFLAQPGVLGLLDGVAGFALARHVAGEAEVLMLAVLPAQRRRGRARALLRATHDALCKVGAAALFLEVHAGNDAALRLYETSGYRPVGRRTRYYPDGGDAVVMRRDLTPDGSAGA
ncbi:MAG: GNAT family N-acetyltransferase [Acetobacteraceae bacterium]|nr:GNAT family N-acetyltransferase [Acetobacteraceae bacterium]